MNPAQAQLELPESAPPGSARFLYAGGSKPLDGYTIKRGIGHGGFGEVYYAVSDAGKEVAIKLIRRNLDIEIRGVTQCLNLKHPNLLALYDIRTGVHEENWVIMEYVSGECLEEAINAHPRGMPMDRVLHWFHGVAAGVAYLHDHGVVHRDLKPGNIFSDEGVVKIGDYGLSKFISCSRRSGQTGSVGTVHYMAPEVANGRYGKEIDIYALGVILYEMLSGHVPFEGESIGEVLMKHLTAEPDVSCLAEPYRTIVARALAKTPEVRFHSVGEMVSLMPQLAGGGAVLSPQIPLPQNTAFPFPVAKPVAAQAVAYPYPWPRGRNGAAATSPITASPFGGSSPTTANPFGGSSSTTANPFGGPPLPTMLIGPGVPMPSVILEEPVARAIRDAIVQIRFAWANANIAKGPRITLIIFSVLLLIYTAGIWLSLAITGGMMYAIYRIVRGLLLWFIGPQTAGLQYPIPDLRSSQPLASSLKPQAPLPQSANNIPVELPSISADPRIRWRRNEKPSNALIIGTPRERLTQLIGSLLSAALVAGICSLVALVVRGRPIEPNQYVWLAIASSLGAWAVLIPAKLWEGTDGDPIVRRFTMLVLGLAVGSVVYGLYAGMLVPLPNELDWQQTRASQSLSNAMYDSSGAPLMMAFLAYFGFLFLVPRWWRQADPQRKSRLSLWSVGTVVFWALVLHQFWRFPQPWGVMLAVVISLSVQLAARWTPVQKRSRSVGY